MRDFALKNSPWNFAHKIAPLALLTDEVFNWAYVYQYPADCLTINRLIINFAEVTSGSPGVASRFYDRDLPRPDLNAQVEYQVLNISGNRVIVSNEADLRIDYRARVEDPNLFGPEFTMALAHLLASEIAIPIVGGEMGRQLRGDSIQIYQQYVDTAIQSDLNERYTAPVDSEFVTVR